MIDVSMVILAAVTATPRAAPHHATHAEEHYYLPNEAASRVVSVTTEKAGTAAAITILTQAVAIKETGPKQTVARFGEVYAFSPTTVAVHRDEPTAISFWNLQGDDEHDFMLVGSDLDVLMKIALPPLQKTSYVFTFHHEGLFNFYCTMHQPEMSGQIIVLPPAAR